ncbi:DUF2515 family protein [Paenibacillus sp. GCM10012307]|uniref:DUF2515 family protein n=1 Tax=Paenibacillus roseus TaxID=2798579 RepID=A0A934JAK6_9BACL|nr:DUF2515 family protein [Paenibacillus roseus]MBJ6363320.1 DUF2515 family protein [Paenibacillus roseus]
MMRDSKRWKKRIARILYWLKGALQRSGYLLHIPGRAVRYFAAKRRGVLQSRRMARRAGRLAIHGASLALLRRSWQRMTARADGEMGERGDEVWQPAAVSIMEAAVELGEFPRAVGKLSTSMGRLEQSVDMIWPVQPLLSPESGTINRMKRELKNCSEWEKRLIGRIVERTRRWNRNNRTRTQAYWDFYRRHPEVHWALLAHMVSRNGGWNMTDLQGGLLPAILDQEQRREVFCFLERANAFIFGDAYPQLLLYEAGKREGHDLSYLLPAFQVSRFMTPAWRVFWRGRDSALLTVALIVNEQHYIENRVVRSPEIRQKVLEAPFFKLQSLLQLNQVVFPYALHAERTKLAGLILEDFSDVQERIEFGKRLYAMLFRIPDIYGGVVNFARTVRHTGSRADYAPQLFASKNDRLHGASDGANHHSPFSYKAESAAGDHTHTDDTRPLIFSPGLSDAWVDQPLVQPEEGDWFRNAADVERYFAGLPLPPSFEMTNEYEFGLHKIEAAALAALSVAGRPGPT